MDFSNLEKAPDSEKGEMGDCMDCEETTYTPNDFQKAFEQNKA